MSPSTAAVTSARLAILAGALVVLTRLVILLTVPTEIGPLTTYVLGPTHAISSLASIVAYALLVVALVAAHERQQHAGGAFEALAFCAAIVGTVWMAGDWWYEAFAVPRLAAIAPEVIETFVGGRLLAGGITSFVLLGVGWVLFAIASIRAGVFPRAISVAILAGGLLSGVPIGVVYLPGGVIHGLSIAWLGVWLLRTAPPPAADPAPA